LASPADRRRCAAARRSTRLSALMRGAGC